MAHQCLNLTLRPSMLSATPRSSPASFSGRSHTASLAVPTFTARQSLHNGSRRSAKIMAYRGGNCGNTYGRNTSSRGNPFQMNPNDMMAAGGAIAEMMEMARKWQASNPGAPQGGGSSNNPFPPMQLPLPVDLEEGEASYTLTADVPGLQKSDLKITVNQKDRSLTVRGERKRSSKSTAEPTNGQEQPKQQQLRRQFERMMGKFQRTLSGLPNDADLTSVSARVDKGVLSITVQKTEQKRYDDYMEINID